MSLILVLAAIAVISTASYYVWKKVLTGLRQYCIEDFDFDKVK